MYQEKLNQAIYELDREAAKHLRNHLKKIGGKLTFNVNEIHFCYGGQRSFVHDIELKRNGVIFVNDLNINCRFSGYILSLVDELIEKNIIPKNT